jgi:hypothetical protein
MSRLCFTFPLLVSAWIAPLPAQVVAEGYETSVRTLPSNAGSLAIVHDGPLQGVVWFDGQDLVFEEQGQLPRTVLHFAAPRFGSFTLPIGGGEVLFAESSNNELWRVPLALGGTPQQLGTLAFAYDAVVLGTGRALVSAKTGGFPASANDLIVVHLATGAQTPIGFAPGASGPVIVDGDGSLLYATASLGFPAPPGSVQILRWSALQWAQALAGGPQITHANASILASGIDSAGDLALDGDGDLLFVDSDDGIFELDDVATAAGPAHRLVDLRGSGFFASSCAFAAASPQSPFEPFALHGSGTLFVHETDFSSPSRLREVRPRTADLTAAPLGPSGVPVGPFTVTLDHAAGNGLGLFAIGLVSTGITVPLALPGFEQVARWDVGLVFPILTELVPTDPLGQAILSLDNPGLPGGLLVHVQAAFAAAAPNRLGATAVHTVQLAP